MHNNYVLWIHFDINNINCSSSHNVENIIFRISFHTIFSYLVTWLSSVLKNKHHSSVKLFYPEQTSERSKNAIVKSLQEECNKLNNPMKMLFVLCSMRGVIVWRWAREGGQNKGWRICVFIVVKKQKNLELIYAFIWLNLQQNNRPKYKAEWVSGRYSRLKCPPLPFSLPQHTHKRAQLCCFWGSPPCFLC